jgi:hypothetical protein
VAEWPSAAERSNQPQGIETKKRFAVRFRFLGGKTLHRGLLAALVLDLEPMLELTVHDFEHSCNVRIRGHHFDPVRLAVAILAFENVTDTEQRQTSPLSLQSGLNIEGSGIPLLSV